MSACQSIDCCETPIWTLPWTDVGTVNSLLQCALYIEVPADDIGDGILFGNPDANTIFGNPDANEIFGNPDAT